MSKTHIPLNRIADNPHQVRIGTGDLDNLAQSILAHGLRQLPEGRLLSDGEPVTGPFSEYTSRVDAEWRLTRNKCEVQLASGHRRAAAVQLLNDDDTVSKAQLANLGLVPGHVPVNMQRLSDEEMLDIGTAENLDREELSPIEEARLIQEHVDADRKLDAIAPHFGGRSTSWVSNRKRLLKLPTYVQEHVHGGEISVRQAQALVRHQEVVEEAKEVLHSYMDLNSRLHAGTLEHAAIDGVITSDEIRERTETLKAVIEGAKEATRISSDQDPDQTDTYVRVPREKLDQWIKTTISMSDAYDDDAFGRMQNLNYDLNEDMREVLSEHAT